MRPLLFAVVMTLSFVSEAAAVCSCADVPDPVRGAPGLLFGTVERSRLRADGSSSTAVMTLRVERSWGIEAPRRVTLTSDMSTLCGRYFRPGTSIALPLGSLEWAWLDTSDPLPVYTWSETVELLEEEILVGACDRIRETDSPDGIEEARGPGYRPPGPRWELGGLGVLFLEVGWRVMAVVLTLGVAYRWLR